MKSNYFVLLLVVLFSVSSVSFSQPVPRPKLVVGIVVDQMRWDYLYRFYDRYGKGGFKRLLKEGFSCDNTRINYLPSYTAVGHSTIFTGSVPAVHGIVGNDWIDQQTGRRWYCTEDTTVQTVGSTSAAGKMSPHNLLASTITDELKLATNFRARVVGVSLKDRASILPAGHTPDGAFWLDDASENFITSTYYMNELPGWVKAFNKKREPEKLVAANWRPLYPLSTYAQSTSDKERWEGMFKGETASVFPHATATIYRQNHESLRATPFGNTLTLDFARAAIQGYGLGKSGSTDFLTINCASTDYVGHMYGPNSVEVEDTYLRLDKDLAGFFSYLDQAVGKGNYLLFLTADHGAAHSVNFLKEHNVPSGFFPMTALMQELNKVLAAKFGVQALVRSGINYHVNFELGKIADSHLDLDAVKKTAVEFLELQPGVAFVFDIDHIGERPVPEPIKTMVVNGYNKKRCGQVMVIPEPGWFEGSKTGTTHGSWNAYDTHIPLIFMGWGIAHGSTNAVTRMTDIAPTLAALLRLQMPNGTVGKPIEMIRK